MKTLLAVSLVVMLGASTALATDPPLYLCDVEPDLNDGILICPGNPVPINGTTYTVTVRNEYNVPISNAAVEFQFHPDIDVCDDAVHTGVTDQSGVTVVTVRGSGCVQSTYGACIVKANGVMIWMFSNCKSPDNGSNHTSNGDGTVGIHDLVVFANEFNGTQDDCHDYDNTGTTGVSDLPFFGDAFAAANHCTLYP